MRVPWRGLHRLVRWVSSAERNDFPAPPRAQDQGQRRAGEEHVGEEAPGGIVAGADRLAGDLHAGEGVDPFPKGTLGAGARVDQVPRADRGDIGHDPGELARGIATRGARFIIVNPSPGDHHFRAIVTIPKPGARPGTWSKIRPH